MVDQLQELLEKTDHLSTSQSWFRPGSFLTVYNTCAPGTALPACMLPDHVQGFGTSVQRPKQLGIRVLHS